MFQFFLEYSSFYLLINFDFFVTSYDLDDIASSSSKDSSKFSSDFVNMKALVKRVKIHYFSSSRLKSFLEAFILC
jgi:hypothetical protein